MSKIVLEAQKIAKTFTHPAPLELFCDISLKVAQGQSVAIVGRSGEGKTTLLHILGTLDTPTSGRLEVSGTEVTLHNSHLLRNQHIGFVFQAFHLLDDATVLENLLLPLAIARANLKQCLPKALDLLKRLGLYERRALHALKLSGGEKQRLAIGRAFISNPDIILADEPTGNLDHQTAEEIQALLFDWVKDIQKAMICVTHSQALAKRCDATYLLESGTLTPTSL